MLALKQDISDAMNEYMNAHNLGFNDVAQKFGKSPSQVSRIMKDEGNLTLATITQLYAFMGKKARM